MTTTVTLLGTGSPLPTPHQAGPATLIRAGHAVLLADCGRGVVMRLAQAGVFPAGLSAVLLTHLHSDHITDLNDVITTHWIMTAGPVPLPVIGPPGTRRVVDAVLAMLALDQGYRQAHHADLAHPMTVAVTEVGPGAKLDVAGATILTRATDHRPVEPAVGYRIEHEGAAVAIGGDGVPCAGLDDLCAGADVYVQTVMRADLISLVASPRLREILTYHSTIEQAAQTAERAGVRIFLPTHFLPAIMPGDEQTWHDRAAAHFSGEIVIGGDLTTVSATAAPG
jgi:ribonuclease Z